MSSRWTMPRKTLPGLRVLLLEVRLDGPVERFLAAVEVGARDAGRLGDGQAVVVLVQHVQGVHPIIVHPAGRGFPCNWSNTATATAPPASHSSTAMSLDPLDGISLTDILHAADPTSLTRRRSERLSVKDVTLLPPIDRQEVWAAGVTYLRSKTAREEESAVAGGATFLRPRLHRPAAGAVLQGDAAARRRPRPADPGPGRQPAGACRSRSWPWSSRRTCRSSATRSATT